MKSPTTKQLAILEAIADGAWHERDQWPWSVVHALLRRDLVKQKSHGWRPSGPDLISPIFYLQITEDGQRALRGRGGQE